MKTLDEIISRQDYIKANNALVKRANELAQIFADKFDELVGAWNRREEDFPSHAIKVNGHQYCAMRNMYLYGVNEWYSEGVRFVRYYDDAYDYDRYETKCLNHADFGKEASYDEYVDFLNDAQDIMRELDECETQRVQEIEKAIKNADGIK